VRDRHRTLDPTVATGTILYLADGTIQSCNIDACKIWGYSIEQLIGTSFFDLPWRIVSEQCATDIAIATPEIFCQPMSDLSLGFIQPNGNLIKLSVSTIFLCKAESNELYGVEVSFFNLAQTVDLEGTAERASDDSYCDRLSQLESERRLKFATDVSGIGMWFWDLHRDVVEWTDLGKQIFGLATDSEASFKQCFEMIHPEDRHLVREELDRALAEKSPYSIEYRVIWSDNSVHWLAAKGRGVYNSQGESISMMGTIQDISDRHITEQKLRDSEQLLRLALKNAKAGMWDWDLITNEITWSPENYELYGIERQITPLRFQDWEHTLHPNDIETNTTEIEKAISGESDKLEVEFRIIHPQRGTRWILGVGDATCNAAGMPMRLTGLNLDITSLKETEAAFQRSKQDLRQREHELELITEVIPQQIWTADKDGRIDYINHRSSNYTGLNLKQMQGWSWATIVHPEDIAAIKAAWTKSIQTGGNFNLEVRLRNTVGTYSWFLSKARPLLNERKEIIKWYGTNTNINRIKELEETLRQQTKDLIQANQLKDDFLAIVSHELRTPLNPILGWAQLLTGGRLDSELVSQGIAIIERNAKLQAQLIDDLLDVSRILRGKLKLNKKPLSLESAIRLALTTIQLAAEAKSIQIHTTYEPEIGQVLGDISRLQQVIWNLLANAVKFTPAGGQILVKLNKINTKAVIEITDSGKGIEPKFIPYVFDRFRQESNPSTREFGGLGLGLAIVKHLTELHGGTVDVSSPGLDRGATFRVKLPIMNLYISESVDFSPFEQSIQQNRFNGKTILVVDDDLDSLNILTVVLQQEGATVISVDSAKAALEVFDRTTPDLIISDIGMPDTDGYNLIRAIRQLPEGANIPALALTAYAAEIDVRQSLEAGFQQHLSKPLDISQLITAIVEAIKSIS